ncbi:head maturation protease, ClpP-related [Enterococcus sp. LJL90]
MAVKIKINGPIISNDDKWIYDWLDMDATCPNDVLNKLPETNEDVEITINSGGGLVDQGNEIYTALRSYDGNVTANIVWAGSAASIIAMGANKVAISPVGQIMIHNVQMGAGGDYHDMEKASEILQKANHSLANAYVEKTGKSKDEILALMDNETWLTAEESIEKGFADEVMFENEERVQLIAHSGNGLIPKKLINEVKKLKNQQPPSMQLNFNDDQINKIIHDVTEQIKKDFEIEDENMEGDSPFVKFIF